MITIGIPFYNDEHFLDFAIQSVFNQTYTDWKLILISDGGTDNSLSIARKYEDDPRVTIISDGENRKLPFRLNQIAQLSTTKYLARMDADDIMHPERIEKQLDILEKNPDIDVLGTNAFSIDDTNNIQGLRMKIGEEGYQLIDARSFIHPSIMAKTKWFRDNPYDDKAVRCEDAELWIRTYNVNIFKVYTKPLLFYREISAGFYKKYLTSTYGLKYIASKLYKKNKVEGLKYFFNGFVRYKITGSIYYLFSIANLEHALISKRNIGDIESFEEGNNLLNKMLQEN